MPKQSEQFNMRFSPELLKRLKVEAKKAKLTQTQFIRRLLIRYFDDVDIKQSIEARKARELCDEKFNVEESYS